MLPNNQLWRYVYLASLEQDAPNYAQARLGDVLSPFTYAMNDAGKAIDPLISATKLLEQIAASEATKEQLAINNYLKKLDQYINDPSVPESLKTSLNKQKQQLEKSLENGVLIDDFSLINSINIIKQNINTYERRLKELTNQSNVSVPKRFEIRIQESLENFFRHQSDVGAKTLINKSKSTKEDVQRDRILKKQLTKIIEANPILGTLPKVLHNEIMALLFIDFNNWVENISSYHNSYETISTKQFGHELIKLIDEYASKDNILNEQTHLQKIINSSMTDTIQLINDMHQFWHSEYLSQDEIIDIELKKILAEEENKGRSKKEKIKNIITSNGVKLSLKQAEELYTTYIENISTNDDKRYTFTFHTNTSHGNFYELIQTILSSAVNIKGNVAADLLAPIGTFTISYNERATQKELINLSGEIGNLLTEAFQSEEKRTLQNLDEAIIRQKKTNQLIKEKLTESEKKVQSISEDLGNIFIAHESLKLYKTAETKNNNSFHGRTMNILSVLTKLYASPEIANAIIGREQLITYLINLDPITLTGTKNKEPLEVYLSLFAGLLMFDDLEELSADFISQIENETAGQTINYLHVYNINGIYFPISIILNHLITELHNAIDMLDINLANTFSVKLSLDKHLSQPERGHSKQQDWNNLSNTAMSNIKVKIHFFKGFTDYITNIFNFYNS